jgi:hypothetical protein
MADPLLPLPCYECRHCDVIEGSLPIIGRHATLDSIARSIPNIRSLLYLTQLSALPDPALISINDPNYLSPSQTKLKHISSALTIAVLMRGTVRCITVRQLVSPRHADPFYLCTRLQRRRSSRSDIRLLLGICIGCDVFEKDEDVVGRTRA